MSVYLINFIVLGAVTASALYWQELRARKDATSQLMKGSDGSDEDDYDDDSSNSDDYHDDKQDVVLARFTGFRKHFLQVYILAVAADWLQGSFIYSLYKNTHLLPEETIAALFATGFLSGAISATFVGAVADRFGRKRLCLVYCLLYSFSCLSVLSSDLNVLFLGRILGGISTTLLFTVFESWMVAEYHRLGFARSTVACSISNVYGIMSTANGLVAVACGLVAEVVVRLTGSEKAPFMVSIGCLTLCGICISRYWVENYGTQTELTTKATWATMKSTLAELTEPRVLSLGYAICALEGSMYIMVYSWPSAITSALQPGTSTTSIASTSATSPTTTPPFGLFFASFMCALTLGSLLFSHLTKSPNGNSLSLSSQTLQLALSVSALALLLSIYFQTVVNRFWAFCIFEACLGFYFPSLGYLRARIVGDGNRGSVYALLRVPLNAFVLVTLYMVEDGDLSRENRFLMCGVILLFGTLLTRRFI